MKTIFLILLSCPLIGFGQVHSLDNLDSGIHFIQGLSWSAIQAKAKAENKYIFLDCSATWCGPCKYMEKNIFGRESVGSFFNLNFINVKVQMDQTSSDNQHIKNWYADAKYISIKYNISSYPTYLFFSPDGILLHKINGSSRTDADFLVKAIDALDPNKQYYTLVARENELKNDSVALLRVLEMAFDFQDMEHIRSFGRDYLNSIKNPYTQKNIRLIFRLTNLDKTYTGKGIEFFVSNVYRINNVMKDSSFVVGAISTDIFDEVVEPVFMKTKYPIRWNLAADELKSKYSILGPEFMKYSEAFFQNRVKKEVDVLLSRIPVNFWNNVYDSLRSMFPDCPNLERIMLTEKTEMYSKLMLWKECVASCYELLKKYGSQMKDREMNALIWDDLFLHTDDRKVLNYALNLMKPVAQKSAENSKDISSLLDFWDTYANLLYKLGRQDDAVIWEKKVVQLAIRQDSNYVSEYTTTLKKMTKGEPTWEIPAS